MSWASSIERTRRRTTVPTPASTKSNGRQLVESTALSQRVGSMNKAQAMAESLPI